MSTFTRKIYPTDLIDEQWAIIGSQPVKAACTTGERGMIYDV